MLLGLLALVVFGCSLFVQVLLLPLHVIGWIHLPLPFWLGTVQQWLGWGVVLFIGAWLIGERQ